MELLRTPRLLLRHWEEPDLPAFFDLDNAASQAVAARLGMRDEGTTDRWFGLTSRQFRKTITGMIVA